MTNIGEGWPFAGIQFPAVGEQMVHIVEDEIDAFGTSAGFDASSQITGTDIGVRSGTETADFPHQTAEWPNIAAIRMVLEA